MMAKKKASIATIPSARVWERQPGESSRAFAAFVAFRDLPTNNRTLRAVRDLLYPDSPWAERTITRWAQEFRWIERVTSWENEVDRQKLSVQMETIRTMTQRHVEQAVKLQEKGIMALEKLTADTISASDARLLVTEGAKLERLARGQSTEKYEQTTRAGFPDEFREYTQEELRRLAELADHIVKGAGEKESD